MIFKGRRINASGDVVRRCQCRCCGRNFTERTGTKYEGIKSSKEVFDKLQLMAEKGMTVREIGFETGLSKDTVCRYGRKSGFQIDVTACAKQPSLQNGKPRDQPSIRDRCVICLRHTLPTLSDEQRRVNVYNVDDTVVLASTIIGRSGLTVPEIRVLSLLVAYKKLKMTDVCTMTGMTSMVISEACEALKNGGLIEITFGKSLGKGKPYRVISLKGGTDTLFSVFEERIAEEHRIVSELKDFIDKDMQESL